MAYFSWAIFGGLLFPVKWACYSLILADLLFGLNRRCHLMIYKCVALELN